MASSSQTRDRSTAAMLLSATVMVLIPALIWLDILVFAATGRPLLGLRWEEYEMRLSPTLHVLLWVGLPAIAALMAALAVRRRYRRAWGGIIVTLGVACCALALLWSLALL